MHKINLWIVWFRRKVMIPALSDIIIWPEFCITFLNFAVCMTFANRKWNKRDCFHKYWNCFHKYWNCFHVWAKNKAKYFLWLDNISRLDILVNVLFELKRNIIFSYLLWMILEKSVHYPQYTMCQIKEYFYEVCF